MSIGPVTGGYSAIFMATAMIRRAESGLNEAVADVSKGDIVDAALKVMQAKTGAKAGVAVARAAMEISDTILDILA